jgi:hypothetical protein
MTVSFPNAQDVDFRFDRCRQEAPGHQRSSMKKAPVIGALDGLLI